MSANRTKGSDGVVHVEDAAALSDLPLPPPSTRGGAAVASADEHLYGPHTSTIRMNPYVRCVHDSGVPEIRSLQELLSQKIQPDPAEPDTPCLRPSYAPIAAWAQPLEPSSFDHRRASLTSAHCQPTFELHADPKLKGGAAERNLSPVLTFTADSVATPNTFATVKTHEMRILSRLKKCLRGSERHQDMPFGEPVEMMLAEVDEDEDTEGESEDRDSEVNDAPHTGYSGALTLYPEDLTERQVEAGVQLLPCSTRDKAETVAAQEILQRSAAVSCPEAATNAAPQDVPGVNAGMVPSPSSDGVFCTFGGGPTPPDRAKLHITDSKHAQHADSSDCLSRQHHYTHGQQPQHARPAVVPPRTTYPAPVARLEESPYHYIMRNYIGGTFLYYSTPESKDYFLRLCHRVVAQVRPLLEQETLSPHHGLFPRINAPAFVFGDIHGNFEDLSFFLKRLLIFHDFNLTPANILCLGDYVDRGPFSLECVMLLFSLKIMNASKIVMLRGNHEDRVVCGDLRTYGRGCFLAQCHTVFGYAEGTKLFREVTALFKYLPLAAELVIPSTPNLSFLRSQQTVMHPNLYVSQPAVLLHDGNHRIKRTASTTSLTSSSVTRASPLDSRHLRRPHRGGEVVNGVKEGDEKTLSETSVSADAVSSLPTGYSTIADASLARGQPSRHEAHEERILCTHGGIPRFDRSPSEENSLASLRSLSFPRMLTLFPNNAAVKDDAECKPDYFVKQELGALWRRYPSAAPPGFIAACRREAAEAAAPVTTSTPATSRDADALPSSAKLQGETGSSSTLSVSAHETGAVTAPTEAEASSCPSSCSAASSTLPTERLEPNAQSTQQQPHSRRPPPSVRRSDNYLPQLTEDDVRKGWYTMFDLLWSDPTPMELEEEAARGDWGTSHADDREHGAHRNSSSPSSAAAVRGLAPRLHVNEWGFTVNTRGSNVVSFSAKAVDTFLTAHHYSMLFRAHQEKAHGLRWSKSSKVLTIFSSSNYMGHRNGAGCVVVAANGEVQMIEKVVTM